MKKCMCIVMTIALLLTLVACSKKPIDKTNNESSKTELVTPFEIKIKKEDYNFIIAQSENTLYIGALENNSLLIKKYNIENNTFKELFEIPNYMFSNNSIIRVNDKLHFFVTTRTDEKSTNHLFSINVLTDEVKELYSESVYQTFNYLTVFNNKLMMTKGDMHNDDVITSIEQYDVKSGKRSSILSATANHNSKTGKIILNITSNDDNLFVYCEEYKNNALEHYIYIYDKDLNCVDNLEINLANGETFFSQPIGCFKLIENYYYLQNYSNASVLIEKENSSNIKYFEMDSSVTVSQQTEQTESGNIFFKRNSSELLLLTSQGQFTKYDKIDIEDGYVINNVTQDKNRVVVWLKDINDSQKQKVYLHKCDDFFSE